MRTLPIALITLLLFWVPVQAASTTVLGPFTIMWGDPDDAHPLQALGDDAVKKTLRVKPTRELKEEKAQVLRGVKYFEERFAKNYISPGATIFAGYVGNKSGSAFAMTASNYASEDLQQTISANGTTFDAVRDGEKSPLPAGTPDSLIIFNRDYPNENVRQLLNPRSITGSMLHEMGHAMGITAYLEVDKGKTTGSFSADDFTEWNNHLVDVFGKPAKPGMPIAMTAQDGNTPGVFQVYGNDLDSPDDYKYATFIGDNVKKLTGEAGMPVMGAFGSTGPFLNARNALGHPGIMLSVMSYGLIRNMNYTELELAMFQDLGYTIDRSEFFGKSYYLNVGGNEQVNTQSYGEASEPKKASFGLGLQILRDNLTLTQKGHIYANGYAAGGMRIDGVNNKLTLASGTTVAVNGEQGTGVLVSYGRGNKVDLAGCVEATGPGGIGVQVGIQAVPKRYRSYYSGALSTKKTIPSQEAFEHDKIRKDLNGALVERLDVRAELIGSQAAIDIGADAHVQTIALHSGATVKGNINTQWARNTVAKKRYATNLVIGDAGSNGLTTLTGDIVWKANSTFTKKRKPTNSLDVQQVGGELKFNGKANVFSWTIEEGATLGGSSSISIDGDKSVFTNKGTITPGASTPGNNRVGRIYVNGTYDQTESGKLVLGFNRTQSDTFIAEYPGTIEGTLSLAPQPGFYDNNSTRELSNKELFNNSLQTQLFPTLTITGFNSPTLQASVTKSQAGATFSVKRVANAYSQYANAENSKAVGTSLEKLASAQQDNGPARQPQESTSPAATQKARSNASQAQAQTQPQTQAQTPSIGNGAEEGEYDENWEYDWEYVWDSDAEMLLAALDFSDMDGSTIREALRQLSPSLYASTARASIDDSRAIAAGLFQNLLTTRRSGFRGVHESGSGVAGGAPSPEDVSRLTFFAQPYGGWSTQSAWNDTPGYRTSTVGLLAGLNREFGTEADSLKGVAGVHIALGHRELKTRSGITSKSRADTMRLGAHAVIRPTDNLYVAGLANIGLENIKTWRDVTFEGYTRSSKADYTALIATASVRTGYEWQRDGWRFGPLAGLEYAGHRRPKVTESGGGASSMWLDADTLNSLRTQVGFGVQADGALSENTRWRASLTGLWAHELLKNTITTQVAFAESRDVGFTVRHPHGGRDALVLQGSVSLEMTETFSLSAFAGTELFRKGSTSGQVGLGVEWNF